MTSWGDASLAPQVTIVKVALLQKQLIVLAHLAAMEPWKLRLRLQAVLEVLELL